MSIIQNIKSFIDDYNRYKNLKDTKALVNKKTINRRNILKFIKLKNFSEKYSNKLYKHFGIMNDLPNYELLTDMLGEKRIKEVLDNQELTTSQIADSLLTPENSEIFYNAEKEHAFLKIMSEHIAYNRATGLDLSSLNKGVRPNSFTRKSYNSYSETILDIWKENNVSKEVLKEIYDMYGDEIVSQYNSDMNLRNKTVLMTDEKMNESAVGGIEDHVTYYSEDNFKEIFDKYFKGEELRKNEEYILMGLLTKTTDLISLYSVKCLKEKPDFIKSEIKLGIFQDIVVADKKYTNDERKKLVSLDRLWNINDLARYNNLLVLKERISNLYEGKELSEKIAYIDDIISKPLEEVIEKADNIAEGMDSIFMEYEIDNRENIIKSVYNPPDNQKTIVIDELEKIGSAAMLHFFDPTRKMSNFDSYVNELKEKKSNQFGKEYIFSEEEKKAMELQYNAKENHFITDYAIDMECIGQVGSFDKRYNVNASNQLSTVIATPKEILKGNRVMSNVACGFSTRTLNSELIASSSDHNIYANKGIDYVETINAFQDFSASYDELTSNSKYGKNNEIVMFRNSHQSSLKPSYVMYIGNKSLETKGEKDNIESIRKQMQEAGIDVPLVIFDRYSIKEKENVNEMDR